MVQVKVSLAVAELILQCIEGVWRKNSAEAGDDADG